MKNKETIKKELKEKMEVKIDKYVELMDQGFHGESFSIDEIEKLWGNAIQDCKDILQDGTQKMLSNVDEKELISKKKQN